MEETMLNSMGFGGSFSFSFSSSSSSSLQQHTVPSLKRRGFCIQNCISVSYHKFVDFALDQTSLHTNLLPSPLQGVATYEALTQARKPDMILTSTLDTASIRGVSATEKKYNSMNSNDGKGTLSMLSFEADKIRLLRSLIIETETMQVLDFTVFPKAEYDVPIFCANFFTTAKTNIVVLDLNPLHDIINQNDYKEKYFKSLIPLGLKYAEHFPWGGKLTSESIKFFSPIVIWTRFTSSPHKYEILYSAFRDYYKVWLELIDTAVKETDEYQIFRNLEAQHRYLTWRTEKDPGQGVLKKLIGDTLAKDLLRSFLFNGVDELGSKTFDDYFPHYHGEEGTLNKKGGNVGKSFENRPWDASGKFLGQ